jgi:hypothetical protein
MRLYELESDFDLTKKSKNKLFPSGPTFTWDPAKKQWLNPDGTQVARDIHFDLMKAVGLDPQGNKATPSMLAKIKGAWTKSGAGIDPKASVLGKVMGRVGGAIGNAIGKAVAPGTAPEAPVPVTPPKPGEGFTSDRIEQVRPMVDRAIANGIIPKDPTQLGKALAKKFPVLWKNTANRKEVLDALLAGAV